MTMSQYIIRRLLIAVLLLFMVATSVFLMIHLVPGDVVAAMVTSEENVSEEVLQARREALGLDRPLYVQYVEWMSDFVRGDWGISPFSGRPVAPDIIAALPRTLELVIVSTIVAWGIGIPLGICAAMNHGKWLDTVVTAIALIGLSTPVFVTGTALILLVALHWRLLPAVAGGYVSFLDDPWKHLQQLALPSLTLGIGSGAVLMQMTRASLLEVLQQDYMRTARAKGLTELTATWRHALKNALIPVVTLGGLQMGVLVGGTVIVEAIFMWPGLSSLVVNSVQHRDYPLVQATVFLIAAIFILITLSVDVINSYLDPRIRYK
jgi:peptide/nickel transport system permease protein